MEHPGLLYVAATLLPLASFVILLLAGGLRAAMRPFPEQSAGGKFYRLLGGNTPGRTGAYIATTAMGLAFVLCLIGFVFYVQDPTYLSEGQKAAPGYEEGLAAHTYRWSGTFDWASVSQPSQWATILRLGYRIDSLNAIMFLMVTFIATLIHIFSIGYMSDELQPMVEDHHVHADHGHFKRRGRFGRFFLYLSLFCFSMLNLILADNLFQVFLSWELVGICSYLLIGFYYERRSASNAANKAFITNRVGDAGFIIGVLVLWTQVGTLNFEEIFHTIRAPEAAVAELDSRHGLSDTIVRAEILPDKVAGGQKLKLAANGDQVILFPHSVEHNEIVRRSMEAGIVDAKEAPSGREFGSMPYWALVIAGLGIFLGCVGKSAQFPLHVWLPDAMEGPTPVSALIHAATMVAAGVYLVGRTYPLFTPEARLVIAYTGAITLFMAATIAIVMTDIKKVLAYSTVSQLGYMMLAMGVGGWVAGLFHLVAHAFFKALLFLCSGSVIYGCHHEQEMTKMGGLYPKMKITAITMFVGVLAIAGIPLFSGWYSKDAILGNALGFVLAHPQHGLLFALPLLTAGLTTFYMFRMWFMTFTGKPRDEHVFEHAHESPRTMTVPLILLAVFSIIVAWGWPIFDIESSQLRQQIALAQPESVEADFKLEEGFVHGAHALAGNLALGVVALSILFAAVIYYWGYLNPADARAQFPGVYRFLCNKWYFDELYSAILVRPALAVAHWCRAFDSKAIDGSVESIARGTVRLSQASGRFDLGIVDGLVNVTGNVIYACGSWLKNVQTGFLRSYVLFMVLAAIGLFFILSYFVTLALAG